MWYVWIGTPSERLAATSVVRGDCLEWTGMTDRSGYGRISVSGRKYLVHRLAWSLVYGEIPPKMDIDHMCRNIVCIRVDHLRPLTPSANRSMNKNSLRTACPRGHPYDAENTYRTPDNHRRCRECNRANLRRRAAARRAAAAEVLGVPGC
jgi:hypothetical protein